MARSVGRRLRSPLIKRMLEICPTPVPMPRLPRLRQAGSGTEPMKLSILFCRAALGAERAR
jgi:hypothetical protein